MIASAVLFLFIILNMLMIVFQPISSAISLVNTVSLKTFVSLVLDFSALLILLIIIKSIFVNPSPFLGLLDLLFLALLVTLFGIPNEYPETVLLKLIRENIYLVFAVSILLESVGLKMLRGVETK